MPVRGTINGYAFRISLASRGDKSFTHKKEYAQWITEAKREETRAARLEKIIPMLLEKKRLKN